MRPAASRSSAHTDDPAPTATAVVPYEDRLHAHWSWGMDQGDRHFERESDVWRTLRRLPGRLGDLGVRSAVIGALALFHHGHRRFTIDVDLVVTAEGLAAIHSRLDELGCVRPDPARRPVRDRATGVRIDFFVAGTFPGDGQPEPVAFPDPARSDRDADGMTYVDLPTLMDLELASGMTGRIHRMKGLADAVALIKSCRLRRPAGPLRPRPLPRDVARVATAGLA